MGFDESLFEADDNRSAGEVVERDAGALHRISPRRFMGRAM
jgi:hypothetical protein